VNRPWSSFFVFMTFQSQKIAKLSQERTPFITI